MQETRRTQKDFKFARQLKRLRRKANVTQEQLADATRLSTTFIGLLETAKRKPSLKTLQKIASALGVKANELIPF
jgi:transcriptional regulator with XRE-family HTH domain